MSPLFRRKREEGKTVLILDIENGSVGVSLARISPNHAPKIFGEHRTTLPLQMTHNTDLLAHQALQGVETALKHAAQVAARVRTHHTLSKAGEVSTAVLFFSPPWGALTISERELDPHPFVGRVHNAIETFFGPIQMINEPFGLMAAHTTPLLFPTDDHLLLTSVSGEVTELILLEHVGTHMRVTGHGTLPLGRHYPLRTLLSHGGLTEAEARSALALHARGHAPQHVAEALHTAGAHVAGEFGEVVGEFLEHVPARSVAIVAQEPLGEWFARSLAASPSLEALFPSAGEVRVVKAHHAAPHVAVHARKPDLPLLLEAIFVNTRFNEGV